MVANGNLPLRNKWKVESFTEPGKFYNIEKFGEEFICDCPSFQNRHMECKHIKRLKEALDIESKSNNNLITNAKTKPSDYNSEKKEYKFEAKTKNGYPLDEVVSALQKAIRRGEMEMAFYWMYELYEGGFCKYLFRRLMVISIEDCGAINPVAPIIVNNCYEMAKNTIDMSANINWKNVDVFFPSMAVWHLVKFPKNREIDFVTEVVNNKRKKGWKPEVPDVAVDEHTKRGRKLGRNYRDFLVHGSAVANEKVIGNNKYKKIILEQNGLTEEDVEKL